VTRNRTFLGALAALVLAVPAWSCAADAPAVASRPAALQVHLDLAASEQFLLVLDEAKPILSLSLGSVPLQHYAVLAVEKPLRRAFFRRLADAADPAGVAWRGGVQDPPRVRDRKELAYQQATDEPADPADPVAEGDETVQAPQFEAPKIPPTPEEAVPAPASWVLRYEDGPELWIQGVGDDGVPSLPEALASGRMALLRDAWNGRVPPARLRILMPMADAQALYRSLPPDVILLIVPAR
jgi:hypothetical protein